MNDPSERKHEELIEALAEWNRNELASLLYRLEKLETQSDEPVFIRLPPLNTDEQRRTATVEIMERISDLEARCGL